MKWNRHCTIAAAAVPIAAVAAFAGIQSYTHIEQLALRTAEPLADARLLPFCLDGLIVAGVVIALAGYWPAWFAVGLGVAGTLFANLEWGLPHGWLAATVATWPAIAFSVASFMLERWLKSQVGRGGQGGREVAAKASPALFAEPAPEPVLAASVPGWPEVAACGHQGGHTPEQRVINDYLHGRDCVGDTPSQRHLAATHGLHRTKVAALVGPLNGHGQPEQEHAHS